MCVGQSSRFTALVALDSEQIGSVHMGQLFMHRAASMGTQIYISSSVVKQNM